MHTLSYIYRYKNPLFFSLEQVFGRIAGEISAGHPTEFNVRQITLPAPGKLTNILSNILFARRTQGRINHMTGDAHYALLGCDSRNVNILTVHDCVLLHKFSPKDPRYWIIKWLWHEWPVKKADCVTVISESTKKDILRFTHCKPEKIRVIPNFIDPDFQHAPFDFHAERPRILFVGVTANKNLENLSAALEGIPAELDIIGELSPEQLSCLERYHIRFNQSARLSRQELLQHYRDCDLLAFPSTFEGFGLPIIEAQAIGRPVLTSDLSPMREVAGAGACLVDPHDIASIRQGLLRIIGEKEYRDELVRSGLENVERFRLHTIVDQYVHLYRELLQKKKEYATP